jgi:hypothetical protein
MTLPTNKCEESASSRWKKEAASVTMAHWEMVVDKKTACPPESSRIDPGWPCADKVIA